VTVSPPLVTVGIPVYNGASTLAEALRSVAGQTYRNLEILIADNGSVDATQAICAQFTAGDARARYVRHETNRGAVWNFNHVMRTATGRYFMWAAHDDLLHPQFIEKACDVLEARQDVVLCHSETQPVVDVGQPVGAAYIGWANDAESARERWRMVLRRSELHAAIYGLMRRDAAQRTRGLLACVQADWIFMIEMSVLGSIAQIPETLQYKRVPAVATDYHSREEMLRYMGAPSAGLGAQLRPPRANVMAQAVRSLPLIGVGRRDRVRLLTDAVRIYSSEGGLTFDARDIVSTLMTRRARSRARSTPDKLRP